MDDHSSSTAQRIVLSREELLFVLHQLNATTLPGLDADPLGNLTPEGEALAMAVAERALRARNLVHSGDHAAAVRIHETLLTMIGVCLYAQQAIFLYHPGAGQSGPLRYFGYLRGNNVVAHTHPELALHQFALLPSREALFTEILTHCHCPEDIVSPQQFTLPFFLFEQVQQAINEGRSEAAKQSLANAKVPTDDASAFLALLSDDYKLSIIQTVTHKSNNTVTQREMVLFWKSHDAWLAFSAKHHDQTEMFLRKTNRSELRQLWAQWL